MTEQPEIPEYAGKALEALFSPPDEVFYCGICDGLRRKDHECVCCLTGKKAAECDCEACVQGQRKKPQGAST